MRVYLTILALMFSVVSAAAELGVPIHTFQSRSVAPGGRVALWTAYQFARDCRSTGEVTFQVLERPKHGRLKIVSRYVKARYPGRIDHPHCEGTRTIGQVVLYLAAPGYRGTDVVEIKSIFRGGRDSLSPSALGRSNSRRFPAQGRSIPPYFAPSPPREGTNSRQHLTARIVETYHH